jgi:hypothetical protein
LWKTQELFRLFLSFVFCWDCICLWETQRFLHLFLYFVEMI